MEHLKTIIKYGIKANGQKIIFEFGAYPSIVIGGRTTNLDNFSEIDDQFLKDLITFLVPDEKMRPNGPKPVESVLTISNTFKFRVLIGLSPRPWVYLYFPGNEAMAEQDLKGKNIVNSEFTQTHTREPGLSGVFSLSSPPPMPPASPSSPNVSSLSDLPASKGDDPMSPPSSTEFNATSGDGDKLNQSEEFNLGAPIENTSFNFSMELPSAAHNLPSLNAEKNLSSLSHEANSEPMSFQAVGDSKVLSTESPRDTGEGESSIFQLSFSGNEEFKESQDNTEFSGSTEFISRLEGGDSEEIGGNTGIKSSTDDMNFSLDFDGKAFEPATVDSGHDRVVKKVVSENEAAFEADPHAEKNDLTASESEFKTQFFENKTVFQSPPIPELNNSEPVKSEKTALVHPAKSHPKAINHNENLEQSVPISTLKTRPDIQKSQQTEVPSTPFASEEEVYTFAFGADDGTAPVQTEEPKIDAILKDMISKRASDLHLTIGQPIMYRVDGEMMRIGDSPVNDIQMKELLLPIMPERNIKEFSLDSDTDFAYEIAGVGRFRVNMFRDRNGVGSVMRHIPSNILTMEQLALPPIFKKFCYLSKGLVVVTGPTGSGKSTTLAAMIDHINKARKTHIITVEDPIEFVHPQQNSLLNQREMGRHTKSFTRALRAALREDPDIVLIGEMRDLETVAIAIETAETGHLVFGTLHTNTAVSTVDRIIDQFPTDQQEQIRMMLAASLKGVISQTLLKKKGSGRVAAHEILVVNDAVAAMIREGKNHMVGNHMATQKAEGNVLLNDALITLMESGKVEPIEAYIKAIDKKDLVEKAKRKNIIINIDQQEKPAA